jgi:uncharacterized protein (TIGR03067 family)
MRTALCLAAAFTLCVGFVAVGTADDATDAAIKKERKKYEGTWRVTSLQADGNQSREEDAQKITVKNGADGTWAIIVDDKEVAKGTSKIDPTKKPKTIDFTIEEGNNVGQTYLGIYEIDKDTRRLCYAVPGKDRPTEFSAQAGSGLTLVSFKREKKEK